MVISCSELKKIDRNLILEMRKTINLIEDISIRIKLFECTEKINVRLTLDHTIPLTLREFIKK